MSAFRIVIAEKAERDIAESFNWYRTRSPAAADAFRREALAAIERIAQKPMTWKEDDSGNRRLILRRFPYSVVYEVRREAITILAVAHHRKMPGYWLRQS